MGAAAALAAGAVSLGMALAPASAALAPDNAGTQLCDNQTPRLCMSGFDGNFGVVKGFPVNPGAGQNVTLPLNSAACGGGFVTSDCPFTPGLDLNNTFNGDPIITIVNDANGMNFRSNSAGTGIVESSDPGDGQLWVIDGVKLVNVYASDKLNEVDHYKRACTMGSGVQVAITSSTFGGNNCQWFIVSP